jgi:hypothetical protein
MSEFWKVDSMNYRGLQDKCLSKTKWDLNEKWKITTIENIGFLVWVHFQNYKFSKTWTKMFCSIYCEKTCLKGCIGVMRKKKLYKKSWNECIMYVKANRSRKFYQKNQSSSILGQTKTLDSFGTVNMISTLSSDSIG